MASVALNAVNPRSLFGIEANCCHLQINILFQSWLPLVVTRFGINGSYLGADNATKGYLQVRRFCSC